MISIVSKCFVVCKKGSNEMTPFDNHLVLSVSFYDSRIGLAEW